MVATLVVVGLMVTVGGPLAGAAGCSDETLAVLKTGAEAFYADTGAYPSSAEELVDDGIVRLDPDANIEATFSGSSDPSSCTSSGDSDESGDGGLAGSVLVAVVGGVVLLALYVIPTVIAALRKASNMGAVIAVNLLLGWTVIGWVAALLMALRSEPRRGVSQSGSPPS